MMVAPEAVSGRVRRIRDRIQKAALSCGRDPADIELVAASKTVSPNLIRAAMRAGVRIFGESYIQEAREKINAMGTEGVSWHFIGHLQTNKAKYAVHLFDLIHSVDDLKLAQELDKRAGAIGKIQKILIQVNISREESKSGVDTDHALGLVREISTFDHVNLCGLMTMPPYFNEPEKVRPYFRALRTLQTMMMKQGGRNANIRALSMGMSGDFETAVEEGATLVRIGTAIFGERS